MLCQNVIILGGPIVILKQASVGGGGEGCQGGVRKGTGGKKDYLRKNRKGKGYTDRQTDKRQETDITTYRLNLSRGLQGENMTKKEDTKSSSVCPVVPFFLFS